jgi:Skp family chaperone for outer membrane proteins
MKKLFLFFLLGVFTLSNAQSARGPKIGYFDMMKILKSVPEFAEANNQLELKAQTWKKEIDDRQAQINLLIEELKTERVLLTKELIEEKEDEIAFLQKELSDYQQKRFGATGDLYTQKAVLIKPIQDQVFTIVNDIATRRNYDFVYDMSSASNGLVFANRRFDMNDEIINAITRASKRDQADKKRQTKEEEQKEDDKKYDPDLSSSSKS